MIRLDIPVNRLTYSTAKIQTQGKSGAKDQTGFFFRYVDDGAPNGYIDALVSVRRPLGAGPHSRLVVQLADPDPSKPLAPAGRCYALNFRDYSRYSVSHSDSKIDLCAVLVEPIHRALASVGHRLYFHYFDEHGIAPDEALSQLLVSEEILMVGYPHGLYDKVSGTPVIRHGTTATPPTLPYNNMPAVLVDIAALPGSEGSPILLNTSELYAGGTTLMPPVLLGMLSHGLSRNAQGKIVGLPAGKNVVTTPTSLHLGVYLKAPVLGDLREPLTELFHQCY